MRPQNTTLTNTRDSSLAINRVLRNTYLLLSMTLLFSASLAYFAMITNAQPMSFIVLIVGMFGLSYLTGRLRNSAWGLAAIFAFTGFLGYSLGPVLNHYIQAFSNGPQLIMSSLGATGIIFLGLSAHAITSRKDYSYLGGFIMVAFLAAILMSIGAMVFHMPMLQLIVSGAFVVLSSAFILFDTSRIINGGERNYIMATINLYMNIFILFTYLLNIMAFFSGSSRN